MASPRDPFGVCFGPSTDGREWLFIWSMLQIAVIDRANSTLSQAPLTEQLREKAAFYEGVLSDLPRLRLHPRCETTYFLV